MVTIGAGLSQDPDPRAGAFAAAATAREGLAGERANVVVVFASGAHLAAPEVTLEAIHEALEPAALVGCGAAGVLGGREEVEDGTAISVWAASFGSGGGSVEAFHCEGLQGPDGVSFAGLPDPVGASVLVLLPDPMDFPVEAALDELVALAPAVPVIGGLASAQAGDGSMALFFDDRVVAGGAVGLRFTGVEVLPGVSQGAAPIGPELTVTAADEHVILELAGRPALTTLREVASGLDAADRALVENGGLLLGIVVDGDKPEYLQGDFLVRGLLGADPATGAIAVGYDVRPGQVVRLHARDARSADRDLREVLGLHRTALGGEDPAGALVFSCNGRGIGMFGEPHHDAVAVAEELHDPPAAGFFAAGEIGPVGGEPALHAFTATLAVFAR